MPKSNLVETIKHALGKLNPKNYSLFVQFLLYLWTISIVFGTLGYLFTVNYVNSSLEKIVLSSTPNTAEILMEWLDEEIGDQIFYWESFSNDSEITNIIIQSNQEFSKIKDVDSLIESRDRAWQNTANKTLDTPWFKEITTNLGTKRLNEILSLKNNGELNRSEIAELFVTNRYGVNVIESGFTSDYLQSDEDWWKEAVKSKIYVGKAETDLSSGLYSIPVGVRIDDDQGNFIGVMKIVLDIENTKKTLKNMIVHRVDEAGDSTGLVGGKIVDLDGNLVLDVGGIEFTDKYKSYLGEISSKKLIVSGSFDSKKNNRYLLSIAPSKGYSQNPGMNWYLVLENDTNVIFAQTHQLTRFIRYLILLAMIAILAFSYFIARYLSKEFSKIEKFVNAVALGDYQQRLSVPGNSEISRLASDVNSMVGALAKNKQDKEEFISVAVHQLKSPLTALKWELELIIQGHSGVLAPEVERRLTQEHSVVVQLITTVSDLLRVFKFDQSAIVPREVSSININKHLKQVLDSLDVLMKTKLLQVQAEYSLENLEVKISQEVFKEIVDNLLTNAYKYSFRNGQINIKTEKDGDNVVITIKDQGIGIPKEEQDHVFEKFFRASNATKQKIDGSGLGLFIARSNARQWGGDITFESKVGDGSTFQIRLPLG